jgi:iron(III) transport system substrate-binding protein
MWILASPTLIAILAPATLALGLNAASNHGAYAQPSGVTAAASYSGSDREPQLRRGAAGEKELTLYSALAVEDNAAVVSAFEKRHAIKVSVWRAGSDEVRDRVLAESSARRLRVDIVLDNYQSLQALHREQLLHPVSTPLLADLVPQAIPPHHEWVAAFLTVLGGGYNPNELKRGDLPSDYRDLLNVTPRGPIGVEAGDHTWFAATCRVLGETECIELFRSIGRRHGYSVRKGHTLLTNLVAAGELPIALTVFRKAAVQLNQKGAAIDWFPLRPMISQPGAVALARYAPHPNCAVLFYDFMIGEAQAMLGARQFIVSSRKIEAPIDRSALTIPDPDDALDEGMRWQQAFDATFRPGLR